MAASKTQATAIQTAIIPAPGKTTLEDLAALRDQGQRKQDKREAATAAADSCVRHAVSAVVKDAPRRQSPLAGPETVPAEAQALRNAARLPPLDWSTRFDRVVTGCVSALRKQLGERYSPELASLGKISVYDTSGR